MSVGQESCSRAQENNLQCHQVAAEKLHKILALPNGNRWQIDEQRPQRTAAKRVDLKVPRKKEDRTDNS